ncbi:helix-turn-helix domain-containing protein [Winogradskyella sp. 3972H.M.0a.05]|uniref:helix-turn-helix domain-containing protein n=1 Tax=Winogradskyella sp. 3972H.M.0a.05 TaxID=2950277 RepID=UPI003397F801
MVRFYNYKKEHPFKEELQSIWALVNDESSCRLPLIADGFPEILFLLKGKLNIVVDSEKFSVKKDALIGLVDKHAYLELGSDTVILSFKMMPWITSNVLGDQAYLIKNQVVSLEDIGYNFFPSYIDSSSFYDIDKVISRVINEKLSRLLNTHREATPALKLDIFKLFNSIQNLSAPQKQTGSTRYFEMQYREHIGVSPMRYKRLLRIKKASLVLAENINVKIEPLALALGYYDLSHFYKDFASFTSSTPLAYNESVFSKSLLNTEDYIQQYYYS